MAAPLVARRSVVRGDLEFDPALDESFRLARIACVENVCQPETLAYDLDLDYVDPLAGFRAISRRRTCATVGEIGSL